MAETGITCKTFADRIYKCSYFKERDDYVKSTTLLFNRILRKYAANPEQGLLSIFANEFSNKSFTGIRAVYSDHTIDYKEFCLSCIMNLIEFFEKHHPTHILDKYNYKHKVKGTIDCMIPGYNVHFFYKNLEETEKDVDFALLNSYIYNQVYDLSNSCLIMSVPSNSFYLVKYEEKDYTMGRGFFVQTKSTKIKRQGNHCKRCRHSCKPLYINGLDRLEVHL